MMSFKQEVKVLKEKVELQKATLDAYQLVIKTKDDLLDTQKGIINELMEKLSVYSEAG